MISCLGRLLASALILLVTGAIASAQLATAELNGRVTDESGAVLPGVTVTVTQTINAVLTLGSLEESVTVEAAAPLVDVRSAGISKVVENEAILALPLNGRNAAELVMIVGAAVQTGVPARGVPGGVFISVGGGLPNGVAYTLDGANHNNPQSNSNLPLLRAHRRPAAQRVSGPAVQRR